MIISKLNGGIGNQLFQYAAGRALAYLKKTNFKLDISYFSFDVNKTLNRKFLLDRYQIECRIACNADIENVLYARNFGRYILRKFNHKTVPWYKENLVRERNLFFDPDIFRIGKNAILEGYWPNEKYFKNIEGKLREELRLRPSVCSSAYKSAREKITSVQGVSLHVRRSDYLTDENQARELFGTCSTEYYKEAVSFIRQKVGNPIFFIFTDDQEGVKNQLPWGGDFEMVSGEKLQDYEELQLMSFCQHNIIANSTFSWWGAWLNQNKNKMVIAPRKWYKDEGLQKFYENSDFVPLNWIRI